MIAWRTGCSGFYNKHWKGIFYPETLPPGKWLNFYCEHLNSLELNVTFYRFPTQELLKTWFNKSPELFKFSVKVPRIITHYKKFKDCEKLLDDFYTVCEKGLKNKLGCLLFQLPPNVTYNEERLEEITSSLHPGFKNVLEFRDKGWWNNHVYNVLKEKKIIFCSINHPKLPGTIISDLQTVYIRLHGAPKMFYSRYRPDELRDLILLLEKRKGVKEVYLYFNNTATDAGIINVLEFNELIKTNKI